jgi:signal transduction histidine kinase
MISLYYFNHKVRIEIKDNGIGMTQAEIKKLGTVFFRSKRKEVPGTGLGWATVVNICDLFGWKYFVNIADFTKTTTTKWKTTIVITI